MAIPISNVNSVSDTFLDWLDKTNQVLDNLSTKVITTEANTTGGVTVGNAYVNGTFSANTVAVITGLRGGTVAVSNTLIITSNTAFTNSTANVFVLTSNSTTSKLSANIVEVTISSTNTDILGGILTVTSNVAFTSNLVTFNTNNTNISGNSLLINSLAVVVNTANLNATGGVGSLLQIGNTTTNSLITFASIRSGGTLEVPGTSTLTGNVNAGANTLVVQTGSGRVAINSNDTSNTLIQLFVNGNTLISANLFVSDRLETNVMVADTFSVTGNIAFSGTSDGDFRPTTNAFSLGNTSNRWILNASSGNFSNDVAISGNVTISGNVAGNVNFDNGTLFVDADNNKIEISSANVIGVLNARANVVANGQLIVANTASLGNTSVTGFINVSSTANIGGVLSARANVVSNGELIVANAASLGNTSITGFINVSSTANIGGVLSARANVVANGQLIVANVVSLGNTTVTGFVNVTSSGQFGGNLTISGTFDTSTINVGNSTQNSVLVFNQLKVADATSNTTINPAVINVGANASINVSAIKIGNSTVNTVITSSSISGNGNAITNINATNLGTGTVPTGRLGSGTANSTTFLAGDQTFKVVDTNLSTSANTTTRTVEIAAGTNAILPGANSTQAGVMISTDKTKLDGVATGAQTGTVTSVATGTGVTGGTITTTGTIALAGQALALHNLGTNGFFVRNGSGTVAARSLAAGTGVSISNSDGVAGNPGISIGQAVGTGSDVQFNSLGVGTAASTVAGVIRATSDIISHFSDERLKDIKGAIPNALDKINSLTGFYYVRNDLAKSLGYTDGFQQVGVSAQKVQAIMPEVVKPAPIDDKYLTVQYEKLVPLLIEAIKELNQKVDTLTKQLESKDGSKS